MANIPLKTLKFPGLVDTYTVPQIDSTLAVSGKAADAKATGDEISAIKADLSSTDTTLLSVFPQVAVESTAIASFSDGADGVPVKALEVEIAPVQDLHGYDNPWPDGGGVNKLDVSTLVSNGTAYGLTCAFDGDWVTLSGTYTNDSATPQFRIFQKSDASAFANLKFFPDSASATNIVGNAAGRADSNKTATIHLVNMVQNNQYNLRFRVVEYEGSTAPTAWSPYSNICPITGWTGANVYRTGKNLCDVTDTRSGYFISSAAEAGSQVSLNSATASKVLANVCHVKKGETYVISYNKQGLTPAAASGRSGCICDANGIVLANGIYTWVNSNTYTSFTANADGFLWMTVDKNSTDFQIEVGSTATDYEAYNGTVYPVSWQTEAGTVYGGTLDVTTGVLTVTHTTIALDGSTNKADGVYGNGTIYTVKFTEMYDDVSASRQYETLVKCDKLTGTSSYNIASTLYGISQNTGRRLLLNLPNISTVYDANTWLSTNEPTVLIELATPQTYQLDPTEVTTLLGNNNLWADTGNVSLTYRADIKKYIDGIVNG